MRSSTSSGRFSARSTRSARRMLRERPVEAGVDSEFVELDDAQDRELRRQAWSEHVERLIAADDPLLGRARGSRRRDR